jgi:ABC-type sugar transport system ATPase subunit
VAASRHALIGLLRELADASAALLAASDDPTILAMADRTVVLDRVG